MHHGHHTSRQVMADWSATLPIVLHELVEVLLGRLRYEAEDGGERVVLAAEAEVGGHLAGRLRLARRSVRPALGQLCTAPAETAQTPSDRSPVGVSMTGAHHQSPVTSHTTPHTGQHFSSLSGADC